MDDQFKQKIFGIAKKEFTLTDNGLFVKDRKTHSEWEYMIPYTSIGHESTIKKETTAYRAFVVVCVLCALSFVWLVYLIVNPPPVGYREGYFTAPLFAVTFGLLAVKGWLQRNTAFEYLTGGIKTVELLLNCPNKEEYEDFKAALYDRIRNCHKQEFLSQANLNVPIEAHLQHIEWLKRMNAISDEEIAEFRQRLLQHQTKYLN